MLYLSKFILWLSTPGIEIDAILEAKMIEKQTHKTKRYCVTQLLTATLHVYDIEGIKYLGVMKQMQALVLHNSTVKGGFFPPKMVLSMIFLKIIF